MRSDTGIIQSRLDNDFYNWTMGQIVFFRYPDVRVRYALTCRAKDVKLADSVDLGRLREELRHIQMLSTTPQELHYLGGTYEYGDPMFKQEYLIFLKDLRLPDFYVEDYRGDLVLEFDGLWSRGIFWESPALSVVSQLFYEKLTKGFSRLERSVVWGEGRRRLLEKFRLLRTRPGLTFSDFGMRRRFSHAWQHEVIGYAAEEMGTQFRGTSNVAFAMEFGRVPTGTDAHQRAMVLAGLRWKEGPEAVRQSQRQVLKDQWDFYGHGLSVALPDTFGSQFFFDQVMTREYADTWKGVRQDSGVPERFFDRALGFYGRHGVDSKNKLFIPSDGLTAPRMVDIYDHVAGRMMCTFGWGSDFMNDVGFRHVPMVIKPVVANGQGLVKLSDNPAKAIGTPADIAVAKEIFGYSSDEYAECVR